MTRKILSICHAAAYLDISETQVRRYIKKGVLEVCDNQKPKAVYEISVLLQKEKMNAKGSRKAKMGFSIPELAIKLGVCTDWIRSCIKKGIIDARLIGKQYRIPVSEAEKLLN